MGELQVNDAQALNDLAKEAYRIAREHGFWSNNRNVGTSIALMHTELSEAMQGYRKNEEWHAPVGEDMADTIIRILDFCERHRINIGQAVIEKMKKNDARPYLHDDYRVV